MEKIRLGMIGFGNMGTQVAGWLIKNNECPDITVTAICDSDPKRLDVAKAAYAENGIRFFPEAEELINSDLVDAVYIATPHYSHPALAKLCFAKGLHVMLEKPAGVYTRAVREMNAAAEAAGVKFGLMFLLRTYAHNRKVKELISSGRFGALRSVSWLVTDWYRTQQYYDSGSWRATWGGEGGGVLLNQCPHQLDLLQWFCGMPTEIYAKCSVAQWHDVEIEDDVSAIFRYENGAMGSFITSTGILPGTNRLEIAMDRGTIILEGFKLTVKELSGDLSEYTGKEPGHIMKKPEIAVAEYTFEKPAINGHSEVLNAFANSILRGGEQVAGAQDGLNELTLSNAMYLSAWTDSTVKLPLDEDLFLEKLESRIATSKEKNVERVDLDATSMFGR